VPGVWGGLSGAVNVGDLLFAAVLETGAPSAAETEGASVCLPGMWTSVFGSAERCAVLFSGMSQLLVAEESGVSITTSRTPIRAGTGYEYLTRSVAAGDGNRSAADGLIRYYDESGTPPGQWLGSGLAGLGDGSLTEGRQVSEEQMALLFGLGRDPVSGNVLSRPYQVPKDGSLSPSRSGFDLTFQVPKSASALWAVADAGVQAQIVRAHHEAIKETLALFEREVIMTRAGKHGVAQLETRGLIAAAFDHFDSRAGDPHLHTHVVVANRVQGMDGKWRTLDSRALYKAVVAMSRTHSSLFADRLSQVLPVQWELPDARKRVLGEAEIVGVPAQLRDEFSQRRLAIIAARTKAVADFQTRHGREPTDAEARRLDYLAWAATREAKEGGSLATLTQAWRERAVGVLVRLGWKPRTGQGRDAAEWVREVLAADRPRVPVLRGDDLDETYVTSVADRVVEVVQGKRSTWTRWNLHSEAVAQMSELRFASADDRVQAVERIVDAARERSVDLSAPRLAHTPAVFMRSDGTSAFEVKHGQVFTSESVLAAEDYLISRVHDQSAPMVASTQVADVLTGFDAAATFPLGVDQAEAVGQIATSGRGLDVMVGPAGAGKTTTLSALLQVWQEKYGAGSVIGLAPSAAAAAVLGEELEIATDNTAKWLFELDRRESKQQELAGLLTQHRRSPSTRLAERIDALRADLDRWELREGQLLLVDEASLAGTFALERITRQAQEAGAKVVLVGDPLQLSAVEAGGAFSLAVRELGADAPRLQTIHRFRNDWEAEASLMLRAGRAEVLETYFAHDRVREGDEAVVVDQAYSAWQADQQAGKTSLLVASDNETVQLLNARAQADRIAAGQVSQPRVEIRDGLGVGDGDVIVTRLNDRSLQAGGGSWVKNGDRWNVVQARDDGALMVRREGGGPLVMLPGTYVLENVELGYAATTHRAQGATVDTAHTLVVDDALNREALYVGMTRGREANNVYVATLTLNEEEQHLSPQDRLTSREILERVLANTQAGVSAHEATVAEHEAASSIARLADEYDTLAVAGTRQRWVDMIETSVLPRERKQAVLDSPAWPTLAASLRRSVDAGVSIDRVFDQIVKMRELDSAEDSAAVLAQRVDAYTSVSAPKRQRPKMLCGLLPVASGVSDPDLVRALEEREELITARAWQVLQQARADGHPWAVPESSHALTVAAYRDRWAVNPADSRPLGGPVGADFEQRTQYARAQAALNHLRNRSDGAPPPAPAHHHSVEIDRGPAIT